MAVNESVFKIYKCYILKIYIIPGFQQFSILPPTMLCEDQPTVTIIILGLSTANKILSHVRSLKL